MATAGAVTGDAIGEGGGSGPGPGIAIFDFDGTLIAGDSLPLFLAALVGRTRLVAAMAAAIAGGIAAHAAGRGIGADLRGTIKALLLRATLAGVPLAEAHDAARRVKSRLRWLAPQCQALRAHAAASRRVIIVSGALDIYLPFLIDDLPVHEVLATACEVVGGHLTGRLGAENCVRAAKAARIAARLQALAPTGPTWGYGNRPHDLPMLALVDHPSVV